jgi:hypothetical protein
MLLWLLSCVLILIFYHFYFYPWPGSIAQRNNFSQIIQRHQNLNKLLLSTLAAVLVFLISLLPLVLFDLKHQGQNINAFINFFRYRETLSI